MDLKEIFWENVNWVHMAQNWGNWWVLVTMVMTLGSIHGGTF